MRETMQFRQTPLQGGEFQGDVTADAGDHPNRPGTESALAIIEQHPHANMLAATRFVARRNQEKLP
jgi:hypothetical protein